MFTRCVQEWRVVTCRCWRVILLISEAIKGVCFRDVTGDFNCNLQERIISVMHTIASLTPQQCLQFWCRTTSRSHAGCAARPLQLNGTAAAVPRLIVALLENGQRRDGSVSLPPVLEPYMRTFRRRPHGRVRLCVILPAVCGAAAPSHTLRNGNPPISQLLLLCFHPAALMDGISFGQ